MTSAPAIGFEYRPSRRVAYVFAGVTALAILAVVLSGVPKFAQAFVAAGAIAACIRAVHQLHVPVTAAGWAQAGGWTLRSGDGEDDSAALLSFKATRGMVLLRLASPRHGPLTLWLLPDNSDADTRRRLRARLAVIAAAAHEPG